ncbi:MAG TPA: hypothetical protein VM055_01955, partial [Novosphingobium sp.]|nr:hypothetical protein [Novosphingobium sp.]
LIREFAEELSCAITIAGPWQTLESLYEHEGAIGHEYVFAASIVLADASLYDRETVAFAESDSSPCRAGWFDPNALPAGLELYPSGLARLIAASAFKPL